MSDGALEGSRGSWGNGARRSAGDGAFEKGRGGWGRGARRLDYSGRRERGMRADVSGAKIPSALVDELSE